MALSKEEIFSSLIHFGLEEIVFPNNDPIKIDEKLFRLLSANSEMTIIAEDTAGRVGEFDFDITGFSKAFNNFQYKHWEN